jgi:PqqD family protein of HPr-rel-A system
MADKSEETPDSADPPIVWRVPPGQRLLLEDFDDGVVMFDAKVGSTHLLNATSAEALAIIESEPGLTSDQIRDRLLERLALSDAQLPDAAVRELLVWLEDLGIVGAYQ